MHARLANDFLFRLARRALAIMATGLKEEDRRRAFAEFHQAFREELVRYEEERERMQARLKGCPRAGQHTEEEDAIPPDP